MSATSELWLFGSVARGDTDDLSDVDVLVAGELEPQALSDLPYPKERMSLVRYDWPELRQMAGYGSLFLHHLRLEGKLLFSPHESELAVLLEGLPQYRRAQQELSTFVRVLADVNDALNGDHSPEFELSVIATALRHSCILGCYAVGEPKFGRRSAFELFLRRSGREDLVEAAQELYEFRLYEDGRGTRPYRATTADVRLWLVRAREVLAAVRRELGALN
jgi:predicted nucleotidyltransferase